MPQVNVKKTEATITPIADGSVIIQNLSESSILWSNVSGMTDNEKQVIYPSHSIIVDYEIFINRAQESVEDFDIVVLYV